MDDLIRALQILRKYGNPKYPCHCEHDQLYIDISPELVSDEDKKQLDELGFISGGDDYSEGFISFRFGSC